MKCKRCGHRFSANWLSPGIGGYSSPGVFFIVNVGALLLFLGALLFGNLIEIALTGILLAIGLGANLTSLVDSSYPMGTDGKPVKGLPCPKCSHPHQVRPWSM